MKRREFLATAGSSLTIFFTVRPCLDGQEPARLPGGQGYPTDLNAYLRIGADGRVTCFVGKVELGQGSMTSLAQLLAEELDVPLASVDMVMGDTDLCPWDMGTFGSLSIRTFGPVLRGAAAEARAVLLQLAAERLGVEVSRLSVKDGVIAGGSEPLAYAALVQGHRIERRVNVSPVLKPASAFTIVGSSAPRRDALEKVAGTARFAGDVRLPGMLHARVLRPPAHGASLRTADIRKAEAIDGVRVIRDGDLVAVLHERPDAADRALHAIVALFERTPDPRDARNIFNHLVKAAPAAEVVAEAGNLDEGERASENRFEHTYLNSYVAHAAIETHSAVARLEGDKVTVWASTQAPFGVKTQVARALDIEPEQVRIITPYVGGGFGGKTAGPQAVQAAKLAKLTGRPVQIVWSRDDEFFHDTFRPAAVVKIRSGVSNARKVSFWDYTVFAAGDREAKTFYDVPHHKTVAHGGWQANAAGYHPFGVGPWRAPSVNTNTFARESQMDIMAARLAMDPVAFRLANVTDPKMRRVITATAKAFGWDARKKRAGRGFGVACGMYMGTYVTTMAEVAVDRATGEVRVERVSCAQDMGVVVNPDGARQQTEGSITMGLGYALSEEVRFKAGEILDRNFDTYIIPRFSWLPTIETILIDERDRPASGCGEPPIVCMGAVIANAIFDAVGARLFQLPMTPERVKGAIAQT
jgi:nicotinate dehydrogenase subunit B